MDIKRIVKHIIKSYTVEDVIRHKSAVQWWTEDWAMQNGAENADALVSRAIDIVIRQMIPA